MVEDTGTSRTNPTRIPSLEITGEWITVPAHVPELIWGTGPSSRYWRQRGTRLLRQLFLDLAAHLGASRVVEVGAHDCSLSSEFMRGSGRSAIAFEANPHVFQLYASAAESRGIDYRNLAVSSTPSPLVSLKVPQWTQGFMTPGNSSLRDRADGVPTVDVLVQQSTVDEELAAESPGSVNCMWIDAEGLALEVVQGARQFLLANTTVMILIEVEREQHWLKQHLVDSLDAELAELGFVPIARDFEYPSQYNKLYVSERAVRSSLDHASSYWRAVLAPMSPLWATKGLLVSVIESRRSLAPILRLRNKFPRPPQRSRWSK